MFCEGDYNRGKKDCPRENIGWVSSWGGDEGVTWKKEGTLQEFQDLVKAFYGGILPKGHIQPTFLLPTLDSFDYKSKQSAPKVAKDRILFVECVGTSSEKKPTIGEEAEEVELEDALMLLEIMAIALCTINEEFTEENAKLKEWVKELKEKTFKVGKAKIKGSRAPESRGEIKALNGKCCILNEKVEGVKALLTHISIVGEASGASNKAECSPRTSTSRCSVEENPGGSFHDNFRRKPGYGPEPVGEMGASTIPILEGVEKFMGRHGLLVLMPFSFRQGEISRVEEKR
eukprot:Gb_08090 [translate_table: standard]